MRAGRAGRQAHIFRENVTRSESKSPVRSEFRETGTRSLALEHTKVASESSCPSRAWAVSLSCTPLFLGFHSTDPVGMGRFIIKG